jgi:hypothetical protein
MPAATMQDFVLLGVSLLAYVVVLPMSSPVVLPFVSLRILPI